MQDYKNAQRMGFQPKKNLFLVHGVGVDLKKINNISFSNEGIKKELNIKEEDIITSCIAELIPRKNHIFLLKAWGKIAKEFNNINPLFIGKGRCLNNLKKQVEQNSLPRVYFLGYRNDVPQILNKTDIITLVSKHEGLPRSIMEAMALRKSIIASNIRGNRDLIEDGENGFLVELGDVDTIFHNYDLNKNVLIRTFLKDKIDIVMKHASVVIVGNDYLAERALKAGARRVEYLPSVVDLEKYKFTDKFSTDIFRIGWIGSPSTAKHLHLIHNVLKKFCAETVARLIVVGAGEIDLAGVPVEIREWIEDTEVVNIQDFDVGIMPLADEPWEQGKYGFKLIQLEMVN